MTPPPAGDGSAPAPGPRSRRRRRLRVFADTLRLLARLGGAVLGVAMAGLLVGLFLVMQGPVSLGFLSPWLHQAVERQTGLKLEVVDAVVAWSEIDRRITLRLVGARLATADGRTLVSVPQMALRLAAGGLLRGRLEIDSIDLLAPTLHLRRGADGTLALDLGGGATALSGIGEPGDGAPILPLMHLRRVRAIGADLVLDDERTGAALRLPQVNLTLDLDGPVPSLGLDAALPLPTGPAGLELMFRLLPDGRGASVSGRFVELNPAGLARLLKLPELAAFAGVDLPFSGELAFEVTREAIGGLVLKLRGNAGRLDLPAVWPEALELAGLSLSLVSRPVDGGQAVRLEDVSVRFANGFAIDLKGSLGLGARPADLGAMAAEVQGRFANFPAAEVRRFWPLGLSDNARTWFVDNIQRGTIQAGEFALRIKPGDLELRPTPANLFEARFRYAGLAGTFWKALPPLVEAAGEVHVTGEAATLSIQGGRVGDLRLSESRVSIDGLNAAHQSARIEFNAEGTMHAAFELMDREPLGFARDLGIKPAQAGGRVAIAARFLVPLRNDIAVKDLDFAASARLADFALPAVTQGIALQDGELVLQVQKDGVEASGQVRLNGVASSVRWRRDFGRRGSDLSRFSLVARLDEQDRKLLGLPETTYLAGPVMTTLQGAERAGGRIVLSGVADLAAARLSLPELAVEKPAGRPAQLAFEAEIVPQQGTQLGFKLTSEPLRVGGSLLLGPDAEIGEVRLAELGFGQNALTLQATRQPDGGWQARLGGSQLDLRPYLGDAGGGAGKGGPSVQFEFEVARVLLDDKVSLDGASGRGLRRDGLWRELLAVGALNAQAPVRIVYRENDKAGELSAQSEDAGQVARALDLTRTMVGGRLSLTLEVPAQGPMTGRLRAEDFRIAKAPVLARILALGSLTGLRDVMSGDGIAFVFFDAPFSLQAGKITLGESRGAGSALGITLAGTLDQRNDLLDLTGTVVPAYTLNSVLGNIPLLGEIFVGRKGEGVFAVSFAVSGPSEKPEVTVNPLSALAPGFLRRIVEGLERPGPAAPDPGRERMEQDSGR